MASVTSDQDQHPDDRTEVPSDDEGLADVSDSPKVIVL